MPELFSMVCSSGSSGSSGILPRTPSNHEQDGPGKPLFHSLSANTSLAVEGLP